MKSFSQFISEETKEVVITFGRFNPPTTGHELLIDKVAKAAKGNNYRIFVSQSQSAKKDPLSYDDKIKFMRKMFPKHGRQIVHDKAVKTILEALSAVYNQGYTAVTVIVGSDRVNQFKALANNYNGVDGKAHGFYNFEKGVKIVSAGERDPDSDDVSGMSASKMRAAVQANDFQAFSRGLPVGFKEGQKLFNAVRKGMGLKESYDFRKHVKLATVSEAREAYVEGQLFEEKSQVLIKETSEVATVAVRGANYLIVESSDGKRYRKWLTDVEPL